MRGNVLMAAISIGIGTLALALVIHVGLFALVSAVSLLGRRPRRTPEGTVPYRTVVPVLLLVLAGWPAASQATEKTFSLSGGGVKVDVRIPWLENGAYRPAFITVTPTAPVTANRTLTFEFRTVGDRWESQFDTCISCDIELPAGTGPVQTTLSLPWIATGQRYYRSERGYSIVVKEDGVEVRGLSHGSSTELHTPYVQGRSYDSVEDGTFPCLLSMNEGLPLDTTALATAFFLGSLNSGSFSQAAPEGLPAAVSFKADEFPHAWIDYSGLDVVYLTLPQLERLQSADPAAFRALGLGLRRRKPVGLPTRR